MPAHTGLTILDCAVPENIHTPPTEGIGISWGVGGSVRPKNLKKCMKLNWNFQRGGGLRKNPFRGGGMDIFWNYTLPKKKKKTMKVTKLTSCMNFQMF